MFEKDIYTWLNAGHSYEEIATEFSNQLNTIQKEREQIAALTRKRTLIRQFVEAVRSYIVEFSGDFFDEDMLRNFKEPITDEDIDDIIVEIDKSMEALRAPTAFMKKAKDTFAVPTFSSPEDSIKKWLTEHNL